MPEDRWTWYMLVCALCIFVLFSCAAWGNPQDKEPSCHELGLPHWYDTDCCNCRDCRPALANEVEFTDKGVRFIPGNQTIMWGSHYLRPSQDGQTHVCPVVSDDGLYTRCIYYAIGG